MNIKEASVNIHVKDLDRSIVFYQSIGFLLMNRWGNNYAMVTAPGILIGLHPTTKDDLTGHAGNVSIGFVTDDFEAAKDGLKKLSIGITERQEEGGQFIHFTDPDGTPLYFIKPKW
jgi:catechol 2,3-dioxygenase-like lactoylglutathione lyase family enzyme